MKQFAGSRKTSASLSGSIHQQSISTRTQLQPPLLAWECWPSLRRQRSCTHRPTTLSERTHTTSST
jgi:hypothetical protein